MTFTCNNCQQKRAAEQRRDVPVTETLTVFACSDECETAIRNRPQAEPIELKPIHGLDHAVEQANQLAALKFAWRMNLIRNFLAQREYDRMQSLFLSREQIAAAKRVGRFLNRL